VTGTASIPFPAIGDGLGLAAYHWRKSATWSESSPAVHPRAMSYGPKCDALPALWVTLCGTVVRTESASSRVERCSDGVDPEVGILTRTLPDPCGCDEQRSSLIWGIHP